MKTEEYGGEDVEKSVEFLFRELKKEWNRSGRTEVSVILKTYAARECLWMLIGKGILLGKEAGKHKLTFEGEMMAVRACHIYLRVSEKLKAALERHKADGSMGDEITIELDREEYACFQTIHTERTGRKHGR